MENQSLERVGDDGEIVVQFAGEDSVGAVRIKAIGIKYMVV